MCELRSQLLSAHKEIALLLKENRELRESLGMINGEHYGSSKSQKGMSKKRDAKGRNDGRDDFDGTTSSLTDNEIASYPSDVNANASCNKAGVDAAHGRVYHGLVRKGWK